MTPTGMLCLVAVAFLVAQTPSAGAPAAQDGATPEVTTRAAAPAADPMLAPIGEPALRIESWAQARTLLEKGSTDLRVAEAEVRRARGRWRQSLSALLPNISAAGGIGYDILSPTNPVAVTNLGGLLFDRSQSHTPTSPLGSAGVTARQTVVDLSSWSALDAAGATSDSAQAAAEDIRRRVLQGLAASIVAVAGGERVAELARDGLRQALERAALTERLTELGRATELDLVRVRQDVAVARTQLTTSDEQLRIARESLGAIVGMEAAVGVSPNFSVQDLVQVTQQECAPLEDVDGRADVKAARAQIDAAEALEREAWTGYLPSLDVTSAAGAYTTDPLPGRFASWTISAVITVPLWEGGFREGLVEERAALEDQAQERADQVRRDAIFEGERARNAERAAQASFASARDAHALATDLDRMTRRSFELGRADSLDLVQSAVVLRQAQVELALRETEWLRARLDAFFSLARCP